MGTVERSSKCRMFEEFHIFDSDDDEETGGWIGTIDYEVEPAADPQAADDDCED